MRLIVGVHPLWLATGLLLSSAPQAQTTTAFSYQGVLRNSATLINGQVDLRFTATNPAGTPIPGTPQVERCAVSASNGVFSTSLDFGSGANPFTGQAIELQIAVRSGVASGSACNTGESYTDLSPRQPVQVVPYAMRAAAAGAPAWQLSGNTAVNGDVLGTSNAVDLVLVTNGSERARIRSSGELGVGASVAGTQLNVQAAGSNSAIGATAGNATTATFGNSGSSSTLNVTQAGSGSVASFNAPNSARSQPAVNVVNAGNTVALLVNQNDSSATQPAINALQAATGLNPLSNDQTAAVRGHSAGIRGGMFTAEGLDDSTQALTGSYTATGNYDGVGVYGRATPAPNFGYGVLGEGNYWGVFARGAIGSEMPGAVQIDHPQDPENKYLRHFALESPEVLNVYRGNAVFASNGEASVQLPAYFLSINREFSYQLTPVGAAMQPFVLQEIDTQGRFVIAGGKAGAKVSWAVFADRNDAYSRHYPKRTEAEVQKHPGERGRFMSPEIYGFGPERGVFFAPQAPKR